MENKEPLSNREKILIILLVVVTSVLLIVAGLWLRLFLEESKEDANKEQIIENAVTNRAGHEYTYTDYDLGIDVILSPGWHFKLPDEENAGKFVFWAANDKNSTDSVITLNTTTYTDEIEALEKEKNGWAGYGESFSTIQVNILGEKKTGYVVYNATPEEHYTGVTYVPLSINDSIYVLYGFTNGTISDAEQILNYCSISYLDGSEQSVITNDQNKKHGKIIVLPEDPYIPEMQDLKELLMKETGIKDNDLKVFYQDDFDGDGRTEAFAITGTLQEYDEELINGTIWFVSPHKCEKLKDSDGMGFLPQYRCLYFGKKRFILFDEVYATGTPTYVFEVDKGMVKEPPFSFCGEVSNTDTEEDFRIIASSYDAEFDPELNQILGHTWKSYYFHYDPETDQVLEYGASEISREKAQEYSGHDLVEECLASGDNIVNIYYRDNGLIHINYSREDTNGRISYLHRTWDINKAAFVDDMGQPSEDECVGSYLTALCPDIAE